MMKFFALLTSLMVAVSLRAVTVQWDVSKADTVLKDYTTTWVSETTDTGFMLVYSQSEIVDYAGDGMVWRNLTEAVKGGAKSFTFASGENAGTTTTSLTAASSANWTTSGISGEWDNLVPNAANNGYYYAVVFQTNKDDGAFTDTSSYAVVGGLQYAKGGTNGIYDTTVNGEKLPESGDFIDITDLGALVVSAPEPTVLALLALGVAGLALRRKNF